MTGLAQGLFSGGARRAAAALAAAALLAPAPGFGADPDEDFLAARDAFARGDARRLEALAPRLEGYVLEPWVEYYRLRMRLQDLDSVAIAGFLRRHDGSLVAERLLGDWLRLLGSRGQWEGFRSAHALYRGEDTEIGCYALRGALAAGDAIEVVTAGAEGRALWLSARDRPDACTPLFDELARRGVVSADDIWRRVRLALAERQTGVALAAASMLKDGKDVERSRVRLAASDPHRYLKQHGTRKSRGGRELAIFAVEQLARADLDQAQVWWERLEGAFPAPERRYGWSRLAFRAALRHDARAPAFFREAGDEALSPELREWRVRAALREGDWTETLAVIEAMPAAQQAAPGWRYWRARALARLGRRQEAQEAFAALAGEANYYGRLAHEELGAVAQAPRAAPWRPSEADVGAIGELGGLQRALAFLRLGQRFEGTREWNHTVERMDDRQLLAAAELARRQGYYDRAIATAERTRELHDFGLRYPLPYRDVLANAAEEVDLDAAWVYGLVRQESRFVPVARSGAGAAGLMQLMPSTARWVARQMGVTNYRQRMLEEVQLNVAMGAYYLKHVYTSLDQQPLLASAAYNAGPGRAQRWRSAVPVEGAVYAETIPIDETREYVKKVMDGASHYADALGSRWRSLKERLGIVPPRGAQPAPPDEG